MGHLWMGFDERQLAEWATGAGLHGFRYVNLPSDPEAKGPMLFTATAYTLREEMWIPGALDQEPV
jgi:hypothetical protein